MTQLSGVSSPFSLLGCSFMYPPLVSNCPDDGSLAVFLAKSRFRVVIAELVAGLTFQVKSTNFTSISRQLNEIATVALIKGNLTLAHRGTMFNERDSNRKKRASELHVSGN